MVLSQICHKFRQMFSYPASQMLTTTTIINYSSIAVKDMLMYIYLDEWTIRDDDAQSAIELLRISHEYGLNDLQVS